MTHRLHSKKGSKTFSALLCGTGEGEYIFDLWKGTVLIWLVGLGSSTVTVPADTLASQSRLGAQCPGRAGSPSGCAGPAGRPALGPAARACPPHPLQFPDYKSSIFALAAICSTLLMTMVRVPPSCCQRRALGRVLHRIARAPLPSLCLKPAGLSSACLPDHFLPRVSPAARLRRT